MYRTAEIASLVGIHPNTVRLYEEWAYISPAERAGNSYRIFTDLHLYQLKIARTAFRCEIIQGKLRKKAQAIVKASGEEDFAKALLLAEDYLLHLEKEHAQAMEAIRIVEQWLSGKETPSAVTYTRTEAAQALELTAETIRNWERNGLLTVPRLANGYRAYTEKEMNRMKIIRTLRLAYYSVSAILRLLNRAEQSKELNVKLVLDTPGEHEDIITLTDRLTTSLEQAIEAAHEVISLLQSPPSGAN